MLTERKPNGEWSCKGVDLRDVDPVIYGALCRLRDYERTGLNPDAFKSSSYDNKFMYKVMYENKHGKQLYILCETDEEAREMQMNLEALGYRDVVRNIFSWQVLIDARE
jgi:hypothetical protein